MAKFLTTVGNSYHIEQVIINAKVQLTLVTPYLKLSRTMIERISDADKKGVKITLIYGKSELAKQERDRLFDLKNIEIYFYEQLHAKCYHNEKMMIISSMNLYEYSEINNREMGIALDKIEDNEIYQEGLDEIESIKNHSKLEKKIEKEILKDGSIEKTDNTKYRHDNTHNFYLPNLQQKLKEIYPNYLFEFNDSIEITDFPKKYITLKINGSIDFIFDNISMYEKLKRRNRNLKIEGYPNIRIFWNYGKINIYNETNFSIEKNQEGIEQMTKKYIAIITTIEQIITNLK